MAESPGKGIMSAAVLVIGNEILSGRTQDTNTRWIAARLQARGIALGEVRVVPDVPARIIEAVNELRARSRIVLTTGGIGPTHDDITAESIAAAFGVKLEDNPEAMRMLRAYYDPRGQEITPPRAKMAKIPQGARLIPNAVSGAPGFVIENVYVMAGVPNIMQDMFLQIEETLESGTPIHSIEIETGLPESRTAEMLDNIQTRFPGVDIGSYPRIEGGAWLSSVVLKSEDEALLTQCRAELEEMLSTLRAVYLQPPPAP